MKTTFTFAAIASFGWLSFALATCPPEGDAPSDKIKALDVLKNRATIPATVNSQVTIARMLATGPDDHRFTQSDGATITGYVAQVIEGGIESCNCHATATADRDTHIYIAADRQHSQPNKCLIVEVTPRFRATHPDWTTANLKKSLQGQIVVITGWLFYDAEHKGAAENTDPGNVHNWRATVWEIHPVTAIGVK